MIVSSIFVFRRFRTTASGRVRSACQPVAGSSTDLETVASLQNLRCEPSEPVQVVGCSYEGEQPTHFLQSSQFHLLQHPDDLHPAERLLDPFPLLLADGIA